LFYDQTWFRLSPIILLGSHHGMARPQDAD
jgi:hypothetical protein